MKTEFFATGSGGGVVATPPLVYTSQLHQSGLDAPTETILENTFGITLSWSRFSIGTYIATISPAVDWEKTSFYVGNQMVSSGGVSGSPSKLINTIETSSTEIEIETMELLTSSQFDDMLQNTLLELKYYA
jgi:hypothetical protein